jgi:hypothetical protein
MYNGQCGLSQKAIVKFFFLHFFAIHSSGRHEKHSQMLQTLFWVFQHSRKPVCVAMCKTNFNICSLWQGVLFNRAAYKKSAGVDALVFGWFFIGTQDFFNVCFFIELYAANSVR